MARKEPHYFGSDLAELWHAPGPARRPTPEEYFSLFAASADATRRGEASVWYLWSHCAAAEIRDYNPQARIIVTLRNPVDVLPSLHSQYLFGGIEDLEDFEQALAAEDDRRAGRRIPPGNGTRPWRLFYRDVVRFDEQLARYLDTFGRERVHVVLLEDLVADRMQTFRGVLSFLGVDAEFVPSFEVANANKRIRSAQVRSLTWKITDPSSPLRRLGKRLIPIHGLRSRMLRSAVPALRRWNTSVAPRPPVSPELRRELAAEFAPNIRRLGELIGRDLTHWYAGPDRSLAGAAGTRS